MEDFNFCLELNDDQWACEYIDHDRQIARAIVFDDEGFFYFMRAVRDDDYGDDLPWRTISDEIKTITIGKNITSIGRNAFSDLYSLTQVAFEEGSKLERIGDYAFSYSLQRMTELTLPSALKTIGEGAFYL